jgi:hypothetical protein
MKPNLETLTVRRWLVPASDTATAPYVVTCVASGEARVSVACTCPSFIHRIRECKHMTRVNVSVEGLKEVQS